MVTKIGDVDVITNRALKAFLLDAVPARLQAARSRVIQYPDSKLESSDRTYIGRALAEASVRLAPVAPPNITIADFANHQFSRTSVGALGSLRNIDPEDLARAPAASEFSATQRALLEVKKPASFETGCGFSVTGAWVREAWIVGEQDPEIIDQGNGSGQPALVRIPRSYGKPVTVALVFGDGSGTVLAALPGFIGLVTVESGNVASVAYSPSRDSDLWVEYEKVGKRIDELRALVVTSAKYGAFRIEGDRESRTAAIRRLADKTRVGKAVDPTMGIYAAYLYADANVPEALRSLQSYMRSDLGVDLFDVALLADSLSGRRVEVSLNAMVVPFCPMLTQGWQLLRVREVTLADNVQQARRDLQPGLWTTFGPRGMEFIRLAVQSARPARLQ